MRKSLVFTVKDDTSCRSAGVYLTWFWLVIVLENKHIHLPWEGGRTSWAQNLCSHLEKPAVNLILCFCHPKILSNFWTITLHFHLILTFYGSVLSSDPGTKKWFDPIGRCNLYCDPQRAAPMKSKQEGLRMDVEKVFGFFFAIFVITSV